MMRRTTAAVEFLVLAEAVIVLDVGVPEPMVIRDERADFVSVHAHQSSAVRDYANAMGHPHGGDLWVASVDPRAAEQSLTGTVPADQARAVALLSDGASRLVDRFELISWRQLLALLGRHGPAEAIRQVRAAEDADPTGDRWPRRLLRDDASIIYWAPGTDTFRM
jgi:hypothetical protein